MPDRDTLISMARSAGMIGGTQLIADASSLEEFAALVAAQEREANAQLAENYDLGTPEGHVIARLIRARKEET